ncbi:unnamed protein product [Menidia menidia]|uniref:(Atlantic silverside) hypothetical protein n=1 Tax=Menidia menidia TaxID=238744 RepID=A0A8S4BEY4_9TELE|nr:unnamed protein product [Menidia menidia]
MSLPKPLMRGMLAKRLRFHLPIAFTLAIASAIAFKSPGSRPMLNSTSIMTQLKSSTP